MVEAMLVGMKNGVERLDEVCDGVMELAEE
jgi:hypothetical protein